VEGVKRLLNSSGSFYVIFPVHEGAYFTSEAEKQKLFLTDYMWVKTTDKKKFPKRILMKFELKEKSITENKLFTIQNEEGYTHQYKSLTKAYYLKF
jgi:tRNA1(Val) A37 N6-methylase TrmN6